MIFVLLLVAAPPTVEVGLLDGGKVVGEFRELTDAKIRLQTAAGLLDKPLSQVLRVDFRASHTFPANVRVRLADGSEFPARDAVIDGRHATFDADAVRKLPIEAVGSMLLSRAAADRMEWSAAASQPRAADRLIAARDAKRVTLDGALVSLGADKATFALDGDELPINRARVIAIHFAQRKPTAEPLAAVTTVAGSVWTAARMTWKNGVELETPTGAAVRVPESELASIDYSLGKVLYLSDAQPTAVRHTPAFDLPRPIVRDRSAAGDEARLGDRVYRKSLLLHPRTLVEYRLDGKFRLLQTDLGVEATAGPFGNAAVRVQADGKPLWQGNAVARGKPQPLSLNVAGAQTLQIEVDFGPNLDVGDHVLFGDLRVVK